MALSNDFVRKKNVMDDVNDARMITVESKSNSTFAQTEPSFKHTKRTSTIDKQLVNKLYNIVTANQVEN